MTNAGNRRSKMPAPSPPLEEGCLLSSPSIRNLVLTLRSLSRDLKL